MKRILATIIIAVMLIMCLTSCELRYKNVGDRIYTVFVVAECHGNFRYTAYHEETKVLYYIDSGNYLITVLLNADGTPMIYED